MVEVTDSGHQRVVSEMCVAKELRLASHSHFASARWRGTVQYRPTVSTVIIYFATPQESERRDASLVMQPKRLNKLTAAL